MLQDEKENVVFFSSVDLFFPTDMTRSDELM